MMMMKSVDEAEVTMRQIDDFIIDLQAPYRDDNTTVVMTTRSVVMTTLCHCGSNSSDCHLLNDYNVTPVEHCNVHQQTIIQVVTQPYRINVSVAVIAVDFSQAFDTQKTSQYETRSGSCNCIY